MRNSFLEKSYTKCGEETIPRPFSEKSKLIISPDLLSKFSHSFFYCLPSRGLLTYIETMLRTTWF